MLHLDSRGDGPDLVLLHGWGMHSGIWSDWARQLSRCFRVHLVDLPGHGGSANRGHNALQDWAAAVLEVVPSYAWWLGWSLGGLVSLAAADRQAQRIRGLVLLASTPRFVAAADWQPGVDARVFEQFARQLEEDTERTLVRFLSLQVRSADHAAATLRRLRAGLRQRPLPDADTLRAGLGFLQQADMRDVLTRSKVPLYWLLGERDMLVPAAARHQFPAISSALIPGAGHAPFLSHPEHCTRQLQQWLSDEAASGQYAAV